MQTVIYEGQEKRTCPKCGNTADIDTAFGWRESRGNIIPQSWCKRCRNSKPAKPVRDDLLGIELPEVRAIYRREYPGDKAAMQRSWRFCVGKLVKRGYEFADAQSKAKWEEKSK